MTGHDLCANAVTLNEQQRDFANQALQSQLALVAQLYDHHQADGNLYLGGSIGLLQPSLKCNNGVPYALKSDLDLFYLTKNLVNTQQEVNFLDSIRSLPKELDVSVHVIPAVPIEGSSYSLALDDLIASLARPLRKGFDFEFPPLAKVHEIKTAWLAAVSMFASSFLSHYTATHQYANLEGNLVECGPSHADKAAVMALRVTCYETLGAQFTHRTLHQLDQTNHFEGLCSPEYVTELLTRREQVDDSLPALSLPLPELFRRVLVREFGLPAETTLEAGTVTLLDTYLSEANRLDVSHAVILILAVWLSHPSSSTVDLLKQRLQSADVFPSETTQQLYRWAEKPERDHAQRLCGELKFLCLEAITERMKLLVSQAVQKSALS